MSSSTRHNSIFTTHLHDFDETVVDEGDNMKIAGHYKVRGFPTLILFDKGQEVARFSGARPLQFIRTFIEEHTDIV